MFNYCMLDKNNIIHSAGCQYLSNSPDIIVGKQCFTDILRNKNIKIHACIQPRVLTDEVLPVIKTNKITYTGVHDNQLLYILDALMKQNPDWLNTVLCHDLAYKFHKDISDYDKIGCVLNSLKCKLPKTSDVHYNSTLNMFIITHGLEEWAIDIDIDSYQVLKNQFFMKLYHRNKMQTRYGFDYHKQFHKNCTLNDITGYIHNHNKYFQREYRMGPAFHIAYKK